MARDHNGEDDESLGDDREGEYEWSFLYHRS